MRKIGILGGSFDPIHQGHLNIARSAYREFALDEVWFIPAGHSPNKEEAEMTPAQVRAEMTQATIKNDASFKLSRIEIESSGTSYTYKTLQHLKEQFPEDQFFFIMGADSLDYFDKWRHPEIICQNATVLAAVRDTLELPQIEGKIRRIKALFPAEIYPLAGGRTDVSSTAIRAQIRMTGECPAMLPGEVWELIKRYHLYGVSNLGE